MPVVTRGPPTPLAKQSQRVGEVPAQICPSFISSALVSALVLVCRALGVANAPRRRCPSVGLSATSAGVSESPLRWHQAPLEADDAFFEVDGLEAFGPVERAAQACRRARGCTRRESTNSASRTRCSRGTRRGQPGPPRRSRVSTKHTGTIWAPKCHNVVLLMVRVGVETS